MTQSFDYGMFTFQSGNIYVHAEGKPFAQLVEEIESLRQAYKRVCDKLARMHIHRNLDRYLLMFAIDTVQPITFVDDLYKRIIQQGLNNLHEEVSVVIEYANYCSEQNKPEKGLQELYKVRESLCINTSIPPGFLQAIEQMILRLEKIIDQTRSKEIC